MQYSARRPRKRSILASLGPKALLQVEQQIGSEEFQKLYKGPVKHGHKYGVSAEAERQADGITFDSKWEKTTYLLLKEHLGLERFTLQPRFTLQEGFRDELGKWHMPICFVADFLIGPPRLSDDAPLTDFQFVIDSKGMITAVFALKEKLFLFKYGAAGLFFKPRTPKDVLNIIKLVNDGVPRLRKPLGEKAKRNRRAPNALRRKR